MELWPAIDLYEGQVVRLVQGDYGKMTVYGNNPWDFLHERLGKIPSRLHLIDLKGAKTGVFREWEALRTLSREGGQIEVGGGIRDIETIARCLAAGASRVILGTKILTDAPFARAVLAEFGSEQVVVSLDVQDGRARIRGWLDDGAPAISAWHSLYQLGYRLANVTDIRGDGTLSGIDREFWAEWAGQPGQIGAGGGIGQSSDLAELKSLNIPRAVVGKAWIEGRITPEEMESC